MLTGEDLALLLLGKCLIMGLDDLLWVQAILKSEENVCIIFSGNTLRIYKGGTERFCTDA